MKTKRLLTSTFFIFLGIFSILKVLSIYRSTSPFMTQISHDSLVYVEPTGFSIISDIRSIASDLPHIPFFNSAHGSVYLQNACLNGQSPSPGPTGVQDQLLQFIQGPCLPVILVPGLLASKLEVNIDCATLQSQNPSIFSSCGWGTCSEWDVFHRMPAAQYTLWISEVTSPMSLIFDDTATCWGNLIQLEYNSDESDIADRYSSPAGVQVVIKSQTTDNQEECGLSAEDNLLASPVQYSYTKGYEVMKTALVDMGYQVGLTLYGAPYDWRKTTLANGVSDNLYAALKQIYSLTGKPTIIVAHSLGNFGTLYLLNTMSQEEKDMYVANYVSLMNPLSGSPSGVGDYVGGDTDYTFHSFGINFGAQKNLLKSNTGSTDCLPKDPFNQFAGEQWMLDWRSRMQLENGIDISTPEGQAKWQRLLNSGDYPYSWFPTPLQQCFSGFLNRSDQCGMFMYDWSAEPLVTIQGQAFTGSLEDVGAVFEEYVTVIDNYNDLASDSRSNEIYLITNPGVPVTVVYGSHLPTKRSYEYDYDPTAVTLGNNFAPANVTTYSQGDETVPTTSSLMAALKWSWEFDNKGQAGLPNAKPVKTAEVCSIYNNRNTIYDVMDSDAPYEVLTNEYIGVQCDCIPAPGQTTTGSDCTHAEIVLDGGLVKFVQNIVNANVKNANYQQTGAYLLNDTQLTQLAANCPTVAPGANLYNQLVDETANDKSESTESSDN